jgi:hypothetical protein
MNRLRARAVIGAGIVAVTLLGGLGGCVRYYWSKPGATAEDFIRDSTQCISESSPTTPTLKTGVFVEQTLPLLSLRQGVDPRQAVRSAATRLVPRRRIDLSRRLRHEGRGQSARGSGTPSRMRRKKAGS